MEKQWILSDAPDTEIVNNLRQTVIDNPLLCKLMAQRGLNDFETAKKFFNTALDQLHDPFLFKDMRKAVDRLSEAIRSNENLLVFGDYDVDGTTGVALMVSVLQKKYDAVQFYIPDRYKEGYGLSMAGIDFAKDNDVSLMIVVDCGVKAIEKVAYAKSLGVDIIICDHHEPGAELPDAVAILDHKRTDCTYPEQVLSGAGVAFKFLQAFYLENKWPLDDLFEKLWLLVVSIGADIVPMTGENRLLSHFGLIQVSNRPPTPIQVMFEHTNKVFKYKRATISDLVFTVAPRINAAGRIGHAEGAVHLLLSEKVVDAKQHFELIETQNTARRDLDKNIASAAHQMVIEKGLEDAPATVVWGEGWSKGVVGIVASRLIESYYRPTIVLSVNDGYAGGSARSVEGYSIYAALEKCDALTQFGGHEMAAGMTLEAKNLETFKAQFEKIVAETLPENLKKPKISIDAEVNFDELTDSFLSTMLRFGPFGPENMNPVFLSKNCTDAGYSKKVGADEMHLKLHLCQPGVRKKMNGIAFKLGKFAKLLKDGKAFDVVYCLEQNEFRDNVSWQMVVKDMRLSEQD